MARPNTQERRRRDILEAAERLVVRHDVAVLRISDVAAELGMTPNAIRYYYDDVEVLLKDLCQRSDERFYSRRLAAIENLQDAPERLAITISAGLPTSAEDAEWRVIWRAVLAAGFELDRHPDIREIYHRQVGLYESILTAGVAAGQLRLAAPAKQVAQSIMALEDYLGYRIVARDLDFDRAQALEIVRGYAELATNSTLPVVP